MSECLVELIDYGGGNLSSLIRALERLEISYRRVDGRTPPNGDVPIILPGVGAFGATMSALTERGLAAVLQNAVKEGTPYLGICIGLQVLFDESEETPGVSGLGLLSGKVARFRPGPQRCKIPQIGWNRITSDNDAAWPNGTVYFVNSYVAAPQDPETVLYQADYNGPFCAAVQKDNMTAFQFHPEKSGVFGQELLQRWLGEVL